MKIGILCDLDGTLLDTLEDLTDAVNYALAQFGCPAVTARQVRSYLGNGAKQLIALSLPEDRRQETDAVLAVYKPYYDVHCQIKTRPYDGIPEALAQLQEKYPVAIVSNKPDSAVKPLCAQYFPGIYALGEDAGCPRKPAPDMVKKALEDLGADRCVYVGDTQIDVETAKNAGAKCLCVLWGFRDQDQLEAAGAEHFCETAQTLEQKITELMQN